MESLRQTKPTASPVHGGRCSVALLCALFGCTSRAPAVSPDAETGVVYSPYRSPGPFISGPVASYPWQGPSSAYADGDNFDSYVPPETVECSNAKAVRHYLDVTDGCLGTATTSGSAGAGTRGLVRATSDGYFRVVALGFASDDPVNPVKWTDQAEEYQFYYSSQVGSAGNPGFKAFARYQTEDDLYVASWRTDKVAQIQRKTGGVYTPLIVLPAYGAPAADVWHTIKFTAVGTQLDLYLDGVHALSTSDNTFSEGTAGIRIDSMDGSYIDNWRVIAPD